MIKFKFIQSNEKNSQGHYVIRIMYHGRMTKVYAVHNIPKANEHYIYYKKDIDYPLESIKHQRSKDAYVYIAKQDDKMELIRTICHELTHHFIYKFLRDKHKLHRSFDAWSMRKRNKKAHKKLMKKYD